MKYLAKVLLLLLIILFSLKLIIHIFDKGHKTNYSIGNFDIAEKLTVDKNHNYYFEITGEKFKINFQIFKNYNKEEKIIKKIKYYDNKEYKCILPIFQNNETLTDIMCIKNNNITYYHDLNNSQIDKFASNLEKEGYYNKQKFKDKAESKKISNIQTLYEENIPLNHYLALENYKGVTLINNTIKTVKLFNDDVYKKEVSTFSGKYYIVADYNNEYTFKKFYVVNLINGNIKEIRSYNEISFDSIVQGSVEDDIYIFDKDAEVQYKLNVEKETVEKIDNKIKYYNGKWSTMTLKEALNGKKFANYYVKPTDNYIKIDKLGTKYGYYYLYKKDDNKYLVYRADIQNKKITTYLFTTTDLDSIVYQKDYIYFKNGNTIYYYYNDGIRKVIDNTELKFNDKILYGVYAK